MRVLFVCLGNICRSPTADAVFTKVVKDAGLDQVIEIDSAGTYGYHEGQPPDPRSQQVARRRGYDLSGLRGRKVTADDFDRFDYILAMDRSNLADLNALRPSGSQARVQLFLEFGAGGPGAEVPDPYSGGSSGFDTVLDLIEEASAGFLAHLRAEHRELMKPDQ